MPTKTPLIAYLKVQRAAETDVLRTLRTSSNRIDVILKGLSSGPGGIVRSTQLSLAKAAMEREMNRMWSKTGEIVDAARAEAAEVAAEQQLEALRGVLQKAGLSKADIDYMVRSSKESAVQNLRNAESRLSGMSNIPLSESVWNNQARTNDKIGEIINAALARGSSASELAKEVRGFVNPNTPGGVRYASQRLARTELNNAFHATQVREGIESPFVTTLKWNLSGSHPVPDECNTYAETVHFKGGAAGQFEPGKVPAKPHPNCLCYTTPDTIDDEEFLDQFEAGAYDDYLDKQFPGISPAELPTSKAHPTTPPEFPRGL